METVQLNKNYVMKRKTVTVLITLFFLPVPVFGEGASHSRCYDIFRKVRESDLLGRFPRTLINREQSRDASNEFHKNPFGVLGTSINHGQLHRGVSRAYVYLEKAGFWGSITVPYRNFRALSMEQPVSIYEALYYKTLEIMDRGFRPALIGGDHSQSFATVSAILIRHPDVKVIWIDAHADINTPLTSPSGNIHGMPVAGLMSLAPKAVWRMPWLNQSLTSDRIIYFGIRDLDPGEIQVIREQGIENYTSSQIHTEGLKDILSGISGRWKGQKVHVSFDIDALDASLVPATGTPVRGGLTMEQLFTIIDWVKREFRLVSFEVTEFNPDLAKTKEDLRTTQYHTQEAIKRFLESQNI